MIEIERADAEDGLAAIARAGSRTQRLDLARRGDDEAAADIVSRRYAARGHLRLLAAERRERQERGRLGVVAEPVLP